MGIETNDEHTKSRGQKGVTPIASFQLVPFDASTMCELSDNEILVPPDTVFPAYLPVYQGKVQQGVALIDVRELAELSCHRWHVQRNTGTGRYFVYRNERLPSGSFRKRYLHHAVLKLKDTKGWEVTFRNRDGLDCRKENLVLSFRGNRGGGRRCADCERDEKYERRAQLMRYEEFEREWRNYLKSDESCKRKARPNLKDPPTAISLRDEAVEI